MKNALVLPLLVHRVGLTVRQKLPLKPSEQTSFKIAENVEKGQQRTCVAKFAVERQSVVNSRLVNCASYASYVDGVRGDGNEN